MLTVSLRRPRLFYCDTYKKKKIQASLCTSPLSAVPWPTPLSPLPSFSPFHPSLPSYLLLLYYVSSVAALHHSSSSSVILTVSQSKHVNNSPFLSFFLSLLLSLFLSLFLSLSLHYPSSRSLPLTVDNSAGQCHQCVVHTEVVGWGEKTGMSITKNNNKTMVWVSFFVIENVCVMNQYR